jgi:hypothetical protein
MPARHVVVDGSNIATEGSSLPSLKQLDEAVREFLIENPDDIVTVVVDASFGHRIEPSERARFEEAELDGEVVLPPAGAIGRGDAFLLRIADKVGAVVLSNDSFREFHGEYEWLFDKGRLIGGKPVPGIGWIFTPRTPVRGPRSRESLKEAKRKQRELAPVETPKSGLDMAAERSRVRGGERKLQRAIAVAVEEAVLPEKASHRRRRRHRGSEPPSEPLNEPLNFITFIASNHLGDEVEGTVEEFSSHGAFISVNGARCYVPLSGMGDPPPRSAREALRKGEARSFVVQAFDAMRRGIELALPGHARLAGTPTDETVEAEIRRSELSVARTGGRVAAAVGGEPSQAGLVAAGDGAQAGAGTGRRRSRPARAAAEAAGTKPVPAKPAAGEPAPAKPGPTKPASAKGTPVKRAPLKAAAAGARAGAKPAARSTGARGGEVPPAKAVTSKRAPAPTKASKRTSAAPGAPTAGPSEKATTRKVAPAKAKPAPTKVAAKVTPVKAAPKTTPAKTGPSKSATPKAAPVKTAAKGAAAKAATTKAAPVKTAAKAAPAKAAAMGTPAKVPPTVPARGTPTRATPARVRPAKATPAQTEAALAKATASKATTKNSASKKPAPQKAATPKTAPQRLRQRRRPGTS